MRLEDNLETAIIPQGELLAVEGILVIPDDEKAPVHGR
jgi:hypothetical protein